MTKYLHLFGSVKAGFEWTKEVRWFRDKSQNQTSMLFCITTATKNGFRIVALTSGRLHVAVGWAY